MERKVGEVFEYNGEWYQCLKSNGTCVDCAGFEKSYEFCCGLEGCTGRIFKKIHKTGKPFSESCLDGKVVHFQRYECYQEPIIEGDIIWHWVDPTLVDIEIKQNKEDMEEETVIKVEKTPLQKLVERYSKGLSYREFEGEVKKLYTNNPIEVNKLSLKPFDLKAAKEGKPVCTKEGKRVSIVRFDVKGLTHPIIAIIEEGEMERVCTYMTNGRRYDDEEWKDDLMMIPEKKEGWVNVYNNPTTHNIYTSADVFESKEIAEEQGAQRNRIATCKITWEE